MKLIEEFEQYCNEMDEECPVILIDVLALLKEQAEEINAKTRLLCGFAANAAVDDRVKVVHCKECKHYNHQKKWCQHRMSADGGDWYCADGELRDDYGLEFGEGGGFGG